MKTLYLDCGMGAAGDMLAAALYELLENKENFLARMRTLNLPGVEIRPEKAVKCGITGTHMKVTVQGEEELPHDHDHDHEHEGHDHGHEGHDHHHGHEHEDHHEHAHGHHHSSMADIEKIIATFPLPEKVKGNAAAVYRLIAQAESRAHGVPVTDIHFHEVGTMDAVADVTAVCLLMEMLGVEQVLASPVHVGSGQVRCAHGILPVPAPATAYLLEGAPIYGGSVKGELCTPTGAALLKHFVSAFGEMPVMAVEKIGYGIGTKDFEAANCLRALLGETREDGDQVVELVCNLDDMTPERVGFAIERFFEAGALEAYTTPAAMKKSRPGLLLTVICREDRREEMVRLIFRHTTTLGLRENVSRRHILKRRMETISTAAGDVRVKYGEGYGVSRKKYEYEDLARIAREKGLGIEDVIRMIEGGK